MPPFQAIRGLENAWITYINDVDCLLFGIQSPTEFTFWTHKINILMEWSCFFFFPDDSNFQFDVFALFTHFVERPRTQLTLTPIVSLVIGLSGILAVGLLAIFVVLRLPCGGRRRNRFKRKELSQGTTTGEGSPGPSDKSIGSRELDGNESDEKNPDIIPDTVDSDDQVSSIDESLSPSWYFSDYFVMFTVWQKMMKFDSFFFAFVVLLQIFQNRSNTYTDANIFQQSIRIVRKRVVAVAATWIQWTLQIELMYRPASQCMLAMLRSITVHFEMEIVIKHPIWVRRCQW